MPVVGTLLNSKIMELTQEEIQILNQWFSVYRHEVDIDQASYDLFMQKIAPALPDWLREGVIYNVKTQYNNQ